MTTTWTKDQVRKVEGLRVSLDLDESLTMRHPDAELTAGVMSKMVPVLIDLGRALGVEIHPEDCELLREQGGATPWRIKVHCRWHPSTNAAELRGGQEDGRVYAIQRIGEPLRLPILAQTPWLSEEATTAEASLVNMTLTYEFTGEWDEASRCWVYAMR